MLRGAVLFCVLYLRFHQVAYGQLRADGDFFAAHFGVVFALIGYVFKFHFVEYAVRRIVVFQHVQRTFTGVETAAAQLGFVGLVGLALAVLKTATCHVGIESLVGFHVWYLLNIIVNKVLYVDIIIHIMNFVNTQIKLF